MKLRELFGKRTGEDVFGDNKKTSDIKQLEIYSGMRVVVETLEGHLLFIASLQDLKQNSAQLYQYSEAEIFRDVDDVPAGNAESAHVKIRGYNDWERKAVFMEGVISPGKKHVWQVDDLTVIRIENERSFTRLNMDVDAVIGASGDDDGEGEKCKLLNISIGGASIGSKKRYHKGDKFLLKAKLLEDRPPSVVYCEVLRVVERDIDQYEYGCRFLELTEAGQEAIAQDIASIAKNS